MREIVYRIFFDLGRDRFGLMPWVVMNVDGILHCRRTVQEAIACLPPEHRS